MKADKLNAYLRLMRLDRPIGFWLLLWPTLWALWLAAGGVPPLYWLALLTAEVFLMRSAGCVINDYADRAIDGLVQRTRGRPLPQGEVTERECLLLFLGLLAAAGVLLLAFNRKTVLLSTIALLLTLFYPWAKRFTVLPQLLLGMAFSWSVPLVFSAVTNQLPNSCWLLLLATLCWVTAYDTQYACVDRDDDLKIGVKSTAILWGDKSPLMIALLQIAMLGLLSLVGWLNRLGSAFYLGLLVATALFVYQYTLLAYQQRDKAFKAFMNNHSVGLIIFIGLFISLSA
jgi:4-hydroxybenzoate polyprenyltransferase